MAVLYVYPSVMGLQGFWHLRLEPFIRFRNLSQVLPLPIFLLSSGAVITYLSMIIYNAPQSSYLLFLYLAFFFLFVIHSRYFLTDLCFGSFFFSSAMSNVLLIHLLNFHIYLLYFSVLNFLLTFFV